MPRLTLVTPVNGVLPVTNLGSLDNWRAFVHQIAPVVVAALATAHLTNHDTATLFLPFIFALADNLLSVGNAVDRIRKAIYVGAGVLQTGGLLTVIFASAPEYIPLTSAGLAIVSAFLARFYTPTTTMVPSVRTGPELENVA